MFVDYTEDVYEAVARGVSDEARQGADDRGQGRPRGETDRVRALAIERLGESWAGREKEISAAIRALTG